MPTLLSDDETLFDFVPAPVNSDAVSTVGIRAGLQALANRTANLKLSNSVQGLRTGTMAEMLALELGVDDGVFDGQVFLVEKYGLFQYTTDALVASAPWIRAADDVQGFWVLLPYGAVDIALGLPSLDATARVAAAKVRNGIIGTFGGLFGTVNVSYDTTASASYVNLGSALLSVTGAAVSDVLMLNASAPLRASGSGGGTLELYVDDGTTQTELQQAAFITNFDGTITLVGRHVATHATTHTVRLRYKSAAGTLTALGQIAMNATLIRP